jgi:23S rRNA maturation mini-RNase III
MKKALAVVLILAFIGTCVGAVIPRGYPTQGYKRRPAEDRVQKQLVEYWSQPEVLKAIPEPMKEKVQDYVEKYKDNSKPKRHHPCAIL